MLDVIVRNPTVLRSTVSALKAVSFVRGAANASHVKIMTALGGLDKLYRL